MEENKNSKIRNPQQPDKAPQRPKAGAATKRTPQKKEKEDKEKKSSGAGTVIMIVLIVGLLGGLGFMVFRDQANTKTILAKQNSIDSLSFSLTEKKAKIAELEKMQEEFEALKVRAKELQLNVEELEAKIVDIENLKAQLKKAKGNAWYYKKKMDEFKASVGLFEARVDSLVRENELAKLTIDTLNQEKALMGDTLSKIKLEKSELTEKVAIASILKGEDFSILGYNHKGKEYDKDEYKSKHLEKLKVTFYLAENKVAPKNDKEVIMRLIEPDGTVLFSGTDGGSFNTNEGEEKMFTMSQSVKYDGIKQKVVFMYQKGNDYKSGKHIVELYADGHKIGETSFNVK